MSTSCTPLEEETALAVCRAEKKKYHTTNTANARPLSVTMISAVSMTSYFLRGVKPRRRSELVSTDTELRAIAPAASMGESSSPKKG